MQISQTGAVPVRPDSVDAFQVPFPRPLPPAQPGRRRRRSAETVAAATRHFAPLLLERVGRTNAGAASHSPAAALRKTFEDLGATYLKFGQLIASSPGMFGDEWSDEFRSCLDTGPAVPFEAVRDAVETELGRSLDDTFAEFAPTPTAAASIAVVHEAYLHDGRRCAVKVLRPGIDDTVSADLDLMQPLLEFLMHRVGVEAAYPLLRVLGGFREQIAEELDLRNEARTMAHYRVLAAELGLDHIAIPAPYTEASGRTVLTMEYLDGVPIDDLAAIAATGLDPKPLVQEVTKAWFMTAVRDGLFHGDVHAGNLLLLKDGRLGVIDWGIVGRLDTDTHRFFRRTIEGALGDPTAWDDIAAYVSETFGPVVRDALGLDEAGLRDMVRQLIEPMLSQPFGQASMATFFTMTQNAFSDEVASPDGRRSTREVLRNWRRLRRLRSDARDSGLYATEFNRSIFLLGKQLMYFERYGKMFLDDVALLEDREFFTQLLAEEPLSR